MKWLVALMMVYLAYVAALIWGHPSFIYPFGSDRFEAAGWTVEAVDGVSIATHDGAGDVAVLYFMGNGGALTYFRASLDLHVAAGRPVMALQYPSGGGVAGVPSEQVLKEQALVAFDILAARHDGAIAVHGYSLGTGLALHVAANRNVDGVVLAAPYAKLCRLMAQAAYVPACHLPFVQKWDSVDLAASVSAPVLIQHGTDDQLIPIGEGMRLAEALEVAGIAVDFVPVDRGTHTNLITRPGYADRISAFLGSLQEN